MARPVALVALFALALLGCRQDMHNQPKYKPHRGSDFFTDGRAMRPLVDGTVARGTLHHDDPIYSGMSDDEFVTEIPVGVNAALLARGQSEFKVFCSPCHGRTGRGDGVIVQRGFQRPSSFHIDRLRQAPIGYYYDVISNGFGAMSDYAMQVPAEDRWAIAAYVRALQLSQHASDADVPPEHRSELEASLQPVDDGAAAGGEEQH